jgi:hypothetical protein
MIRRTLCIAHAELFGRKAVRKGPPMHRSQLLVATVYLALHCIPFFASAQLPPPNTRTDTDRP